MRTLGPRETQGCPPLRVLYPMCKVPQVSHEVPYPRIQGLGRGCLWGLLLWRSQGVTFYSVEPALLSAWPRSVTSICRNSVPLKAWGPARCGAAPRRWPLTQAWSQPARRGFWLTQPGTRLPPHPCPFSSRPPTPHPLHLCPPLAAPLPGPVHMPGKAPTLYTTRRPCL